MFWNFKHWILRVTEPWREERAALDLEWKVFAKKHNAAGHRPECWYSGMEPDPNEKVALVDAREVDPNYLRDQYDYRQVDRENDYDSSKNRNLRFSNRKGPAAVEKDA